MQTARRNLAKLRRCQPVTLNTSAEVLGLCKVSFATGFRTACSANTQLGLNSAAFMVPMPGKPNEDGEDVYMMCRNNTAVGVFDGVGGWYNDGIDPREFTEGVARHTAAAIEQKQAQDAEGVIAALQSGSDACSEQGVPSKTHAKYHNRLLFARCGVHAHCAFALLKIAIFILSPWVMLG